MSEIAAIKETLVQYASAYCDKNIDALMSLFDDSDEISVIGTGADELCTDRGSVRALFLRNFAEAQAKKFQFLWSNIIVSKDHATVAVSLVIHLECQGELVEIPLRWTVVMKYTDRWVWLHRHASAAAVSQEDGAAYPTGR